MKKHPLVKQLADRCRRKGAAIYAGRNFLTARWGNKRRLEVRVDDQPKGSNEPVNDQSAA